MFRGVSMWTTDRGRVSMWIALGVHLDRGNPCGLLGWLQVGYPCVQVGGRGQVSGVHVDMAGGHADRADVHMDSGLVSLCK